MSIHMSCHAAIIKDNLFLGDRGSSLNKKELLERCKITHIVNCAYELDNKFESEGVKYLNLTLKDDLVEDPIEQFQLAAKYVSK